MEDAIARAIPIWDDNLNIPVGTPTADAHAANKKYVDDTVAAASVDVSGKLDKVETEDTYRRAYCVTSTGEQITTPVTSSVIGDSICRRDDNGRVSVANPTGNLHAANKSYVDQAVEAAVSELLRFRHRWIHTIEFSTYDSQGGHYANGTAMIITDFETPFTLKSLNEYLAKGPVMATGRYLYKLTSTETDQKHNVITELVFNEGFDWPRAAYYNFAITGLGGTVSVRNLDRDNVFQIL